MPPDPLIRAIKKIINFLPAFLHKLFLHAATINNNGTQTSKHKLSILLEWETGALSCKAVARKYPVQPCQLREWKKKREGILEKQQQ
jgi:hypothetical protein